MKSEKKLLEKLRLKNEQLKRNIAILKRKLRRAENKMEEEGKKDDGKEGQVIQSERVN